MCAVRVLRKKLCAVLVLRKKLCAVVVLRKIFCAVLVLLTRWCGLQPSNSISYTTYPVIVLQHYIYTKIFVYSCVCPKHSPSPKVSCSRKEPDHSYRPIHPLLLAVDGTRVSAARDSV